MPELEILVLSPHPSVPGGVTAFIETMKERLRHCRVTSLWVGSVQDRPEGKANLVGRMFIVPVQIFRQVRRHHYDAVHINPSMDAKAGIRDGLILLALRLAGFRRTLVYFHGWDHNTARRIARTPLVNRLFVWLLNGAGHILVLGPEFKTSLEEMGVKGSVVTATCTMFDGDSLNAVGALPPGPRRVVLFMSRFDRAKGGHELLEAFARIAADYPDVDLIMAGDGTQKSLLCARMESLGLRERVTFPGYVRGEEKMRLLKSCALYALPTYFAEGMPVALLEAMGAGKPLLTAKAGAIPNIASDPQNGVVLDHVTVDTVEAGLRRLLGDAAYCESVGRHNADYAWSRFEAGIITAEIEEYYRKLAGAPA